MKYLILILLLGLALCSEAHPSWGIVAAPNGDIYFVDVLHHDGTLWKMNLQGEVSVVMKNFHAHELQIDAHGNLWLAQMVWREGEIESEGQHMLVRISPEGRKDTLIWTDDWDLFLGTIFAVDQQERVYFVLDKQLYRRSIKGKPQLLCKHRFERINSLHIDAKGNLYITDKRHQEGSIYVWNEQEGLSLFASGLLEQAPERPTFAEPHLQLFYALDQGPEACFYLSDNAARKIQRIDAEGNRSDFYYSEWPWHPLGVCFSQGFAYVLEAGFEHKNIGPRIVKVDGAGRKSILFELR